MAIDIKKGVMNCRCKCNEYLFKVTDSVLIWNLSHTKEYRSRGQALENDVENSLLCSHGNSIMKLTITIKSI